MVSEFHQLPEKITQLAELAQALRRDNAQLRLQLASLAAENADLSRRIQEAQHRVEALLEKIPAPGQNEETA